MNKSKKGRPLETSKGKSFQKERAEAEKLINGLDERLGLWDPMDTEPAILYNLGEKLKENEPE